MVGEMGGQEDIAEVDYDRADSDCSDVDDQEEIVPKMEADENPVLEPPVENSGPAAPAALIPNAGPGDHAVVLQREEDDLQEVLAPRSPKSSKSSKSSRSSKSSKSSKSSRSSRSSLEAPNIPVLPGVMVSPTIHQGSPTIHPYQATR